MADIASQIAENVASVQKRIDEACQRAGRSSEEVALVAVTKYARIEWVEALIDLGLMTLGESRPQQLVERANRLPDNVEWHLIGHLQRNKVRPVLPIVQLIHSVDSLRLAQRISDLAGELETTPEVLLEINVSGEQSKDGFSTESVASEWEQLCRLPNLSVIGLMTMAPHTGDPDDARRTFRRLRELRDSLAEQSLTDPLPHLSMGMSGDFEAAIEEGATLIRVGSSLYEGLQ